MSYSLLRVFPQLNGLQSKTGICEVIGSNPVRWGLRSFFFVPRWRHAEHLSFTTIFRALKLHDDHRLFSASKFSAFSVSSKISSLKIARAPCLEVSLVSLFAYSPLILDSICTTPLFFPTLAFASSALAFSLSSLTGDNRLIVSDISSFQTSTSCWIFINISSFSTCFVNRPCTKHVKNSCHDGQITFKSKQPLN